MSVQQDRGRDLGRWLEYSINPRRLRTHLHPAMWGNGRLELFAELERPRVTEVVCFGYPSHGEALAAGLLCRKGEEEHLEDLCLATAIYCRECPNVGPEASG